MGREDGGLNNGGVPMRELKMYRITLIVEATPDELDTLMEEVERVVCPHGLDHSGRKCEHRWMLMRSELTPSEAEEWRGDLNE